MITYLLATLGVSLAINMVMFLVAYKYQTDKLTDASYAITFIVLVGYGLATGAYDIDKLLLAATIVLWALRLGSFLLIRIWKTGVDHRFDDMRNDFRKFAGFWFLQAISVWVILIPSLLAFNQADIVPTWLAAFGLLITGVGFWIETTADLQKYKFSQVKANKGKWIDTGLWKYSRHPNYFGEILVWVGIYLYVLPSLPPVLALVGLVGPLFIISLLLFVSGIPPLEKSANERWGKDKNYQEYKRRTSILVPLPPRKSA